MIYHSKMKKVIIVMGSGPISSLTLSSLLEKYGEIEVITAEKAGLLGINPRNCKEYILDDRRFNIIAPPALPIIAPPVLSESEYMYMPQKPSHKDKPWYLQHNKRRKK